MAEIEISLVDIVGSPYCVSSEDGQKVYLVIENALKSESKVILSFASVDGLTSAFLNVAIGQLYGNFPRKLLHDSLAVSKISPDDNALLIRVIENAKSYYQDPDRYRHAMRAVLGDDNDEQINP